MATEAHNVEDLKARLSVCRQQLEGSSVLNTTKRKEALREEIRDIELKLAQALGIKDDVDDEEDEHSLEHFKREGGTSTPESIHLPPINSPECTHPPSPFLDGESKMLKLELEETPPISSGSSSAVSSFAKREVESVRSALLDAGEDDLDLDALLREQAQMEQRLIDLKRRREEEDEAFALSIQEEELQAFQRQSGESYSPPVSSKDARSLMESRLDRARQERMDAEMARIFAASESSSFNLATSPKEEVPLHRDSGMAAAPQRPVFSIFEKRAKMEGTTPGPVGFASASAPSLSNPVNTNITPQARATMPGSLPSSSIILGSGTNRLQDHAAAILASASSTSSQQPQQISQSQRVVDLTRTAVDLTKQVYEISSSEDEGEGGASSGGESSRWNFLLNDFYFSNYDLDEDDEDDDDDDGCSSSVYNNHEQFMDAQRLAWSMRDQTRYLTPAQSEQELRDLLANIQASEEEIPPNDRTGTPEGMASHIALLEHQKIGLTWLQKMEDGTNRGGILGDDMGLGKTVQTMALIVSRPSGPIDDPVIWDERQVYHAPPPAAKLVKTKATLIIAPVALVYQWAEELKTKTQPGLLKVYIYHGSSKFTDPEILRRYDVVITTNITLTNDSGVYDVNPNKCRPIGPLFKAHFHRVVIDEAHTIKNRNTKSSKACALIAATYRWCLTGTPIQNSVDELYSLIRFLAIKPYCDWDEFRNKISTPMKKTRQYGSAMQRVQALLKAVCLRRTKKCTVDGKPIFDLPARNVMKVNTLFSDDERSFYTALEQRTRDRFNAYVKAGTVMKNYSNILVLLLRLRQACCHPHLINDFEKITDDQTPNGQKAHVDRLLDNLLEDIRRRLLERGLDAIECPICMDVGEESMILSGCGHIYCRACIIAHLSRHDEDDRNCPECRRAAPLDNLISIADFNARYNPTPAIVPEDPKGKGKAVDHGGDTALNIQIPEELDDWISSSKINSMVGVVKDVIAKGEKIIVFSQFTSLLTLIEKPLNAENIKFLRYDGSMKMEARNEAVLRLFDDPTYSVMLISLKCGSLGLNLTVANHVVIMDPWWNPALENQAIDRVHRIGQTKEVFVHRLYIPDTVEDRILALQASKQALADGALGEGTVPKLAKLGLQELMYLFRGY